MGMAPRGSVTVQEQGQRSDAAPPTMGRPHDFSGAGQNDMRAQAPASIEVASAEALKILQRHYGATTSRSSSAHRRMDVEGGAARRGGRAGENEWLADPHMKHSVGFALVSPVLILAPWLNGALAHLVRALLGPSELAVQSSTAAVSYAEHTVALRLAGLLVGGGFFALVFKLFLTAPCIRFGGWRSHTKLLDTLGCEEAAVAASQAGLPSDAAGERRSYGTSATDDVRSGVAGGDSVGVYVDSSDVNLLPERLPHS